MYRWRAVYTEKCKYGSGASIRKPAMETWKGAGSLAHLELIVKGMTNKEIAAEIYLSEGGVKNIVTKLLQKFEVADRTQLAVKAVVHNVVKEEKHSI